MYWLFAGHYALILKISAQYILLHFVKIYSVHCCVFFCQKYIVVLYVLIVARKMVCFFLLREKILIYNNLIEDNEEITNDGTEVVLNPTQDTIEQMLEAQKDTSKKWGPVQVQRRSTRVDVGGKTMLEIAVNKKKIQNLEKEKDTYQGTLLNNSFKNFSDPEFIATAQKIGVEVDVVELNKAGR